MSITDLIQVLEFMITCVLLGFGLHGIFTKENDDSSFRHKKK